MTILTEEQARKKIDDIIKARPHLKKYQEEIERNLAKCKTFKEKQVFLLSSMSDMIKEMQFETMRAKVVLNNLERSING